MLHFRRPLAALSSFVLFALLTAPAYAAGSNMPWEQPLNQILQKRPAVNQRHWFG